MVSLMDRRCKGIHWRGKIPGNERSTREGRQERTCFEVHIVIRPSLATLHLLRANSQLLCTAHNCSCSRRHYVTVTCRSPPSIFIVLRNALHQAGGGRFSTVPCVWFYTAGGVVLAVSLCSILHSREGGRLSTVPCVQAYLAGGERLSTVP